MDRKTIAVTFLERASAGDVDSAYRQFVAQHFVHHNQYFEGDRESLRVAMKEAHETSPNRGINVHKVFEDGDHVVTYSRVLRNGGDDPDIVVVHIFRFEDDRIAELWDVGQRLDPASPNRHGAF